MTRAADPGIFVTWPAERFYFAEIDLAALPRGTRVGRDSLGYLFEASLPVPLADVQAAYVSAGRRRFLAVAAPIAAVQRALEDGALTLGPSELPAWVSYRADPSAFNLLTGAFSPPSLRTAKRRLIGESVLVAALVALLLVVGMERRTRLYTERADDWRAAQQAALTDALGPGNPLIPMGQRRLALTGELRRQRLLRARPATELNDAALTLAAVFAHWPHDLSLKSLAASEDGVTVVAACADATHANAAVDSLGSLPDHRLSPPQLSSDGEGATLTLRFERLRVVEEAAGVGR